MTYSILKMMKDERTKKSITAPEKIFCLNILNKYVTVVIDSISNFYFVSLSEILHLLSGMGSCSRKVEVREQDSGRIVDKQPGVQVSDHVGSENTQSFIERFKSSGRAR